MKRSATLILLAAVTAALLYGAKPQQLAPSYAWKIEPPLGLRIPATIDTLYENYSRRSVPSEVSDAWATTGNLGGEGMEIIWTRRRPYSEFFFADGLRQYIPSVHTMQFYNTRIPMTLLGYNTGGGRDNAQDRLTATFSGNANARTQVGALLDYLYSKGSYANQATKDLIWGFSGSYIGDRYEFQGWFNQYNLLNKENGGITDVLYITDPALVQGGVTSVNTKTIPTRLSNAHTRVSGKQLYLNNRYKIGFWDEKYDGDSLVSRTYIPVTSIIWTFNFEQSKHLFHDDASGEIHNFFNNTYLNPSLTADRTSYLTVSNTVGLSLLEGFHKYAKFGLSAFLTYDIVRYNQTADTLDRTTATGLTPFPEGIGTIVPKATEHNLSVGGQLSKQRGSLLTYTATAKIGISGRESGNIALDGNVTTRFPLFGDSVAITGHALFTNRKAPYFMENYLSNHFIWKNDFGKERTLSFGGRLLLPKTGTLLEIEASNVQNHLYFGPDFMPAQHGGSVRVFSACLSQNLSAGIFNWNNRITYQTTSDDAVIPLPSLAVYSNMYIKFKVATLSVQLGVDCDYYTRYYAPAYQPATASFANQQKVKLGNYPFMNLYANFKLSKVRFFVLMSHINQGWFSKDYFSVVDYPLNPRRFQLGLSVDFAN